MSIGVRKHRGGRLGLVPDELELKLPVICVVPDQYRLYKLDKRFLLTKGDKANVQSGLSKCQGSTGADTNLS